MTSPRRISIPPALFLAVVASLGIGGISSRAMAQAAPAAPNAAAPAATPRPAIPISFKDGKSAAATTLRRSGDNILATVPVGDSTGELAYPIANIAKISFPEPAQVQATMDLLLQGGAAAALTRIEPIITYYDTYKEIPGSWWATGMRLKLQADLDLHRDAPADALIDAMVKTAPAGSEDARMASILQAGSMARKGQHEKALAVYEDVIKSSTNDTTLAYAWVGKAFSLYSLQKYDPALLAYLHVPVFYSDEKLLMPAVLLGAGKCYTHLENLPEAQNSYNDLIQQYPSSPEAAPAKVELQKIIKATAAASPTPTPAPDNSTSTPAASPAPADSASTAAPATPVPATTASTPVPATPASSPASAPAK